MIFNVFNYLTFIKISDVHERLYNCTNDLIFQAQEIQHLFQHMIGYDKLIYCYI